LNKSNDKKGLFLSAFDPYESDYSVNELRALSILHILLYEEIYIPDSFLVSKIFQDVAISDKSNFVGTMVEHGWLKVARREGVSSLLNLKENLLNSAKDKTYEPFEGYKAGIELYQNKNFIDYLNDIDRSLETKNSVTIWQPKALGERYYKNMKATALDGSSGLPIEDALRIWKKVNEINENESVQARTQYNNYIDGLKDSVLKRKIKSWATSQYIRNFPEALSLENSVARSTMNNIDGFDPFEKIEEVPMSHRESTITGRDCAILSPYFLLSLAPSDIETLRNLSEFKNLQAIRKNKDQDQEAYRKSLLRYFEAVGDIAPIMLPDLKTDIKKYQAYAKFYRIATHTSTVSSILYGIFNPIGGAAGALLSVALSSYSPFDKKLSELEKDAVIDLSATKYKWNTVSYTNFCHDARGVQIKK